MKTLCTRFSVLLIVLLTSLSLVPTSAQRSRRIKREPMPPYLEKSWEQQQAIDSVEKLLAASEYKYTSAGAGVWVIRRQGEHLKFFQLVLYTEGASLFTEVIVARGKSLRLDEAKPHILKLAKELEDVKIGFDKDDDLFVRNEALLKSLNVDGLKTNIERIAKVADEVYLQVQQFRNF